LLYPDNSGLIGPRFLTLTTDAELIPVTTFMFGSWTLAFFEKVKLFGNRTRISRINTDSFEKFIKIRVHPCESVSNLKFARLQFGSNECSGQSGWRPTALNDQGVKR
jgi:hypothetical protein